MSLIEQIYESAANAELLRDYLWCPSDGTAAQRHPVGFATPGGTVFDGLASTTDYQVSYPTSVFLGLTPRDMVEIGDVTYQVHNTRAVSDDSEMHARLTRV